MVGLAGVVHLIIVRRGHDGNGTVRVVLEQLPGRLPGLGRLLVCNIVGAYRAMSTFQPSRNLHRLYRREINRASISFSTSFRFLPLLVSIITRFN